MKNPVFSVGRYFAYSRFALGSCSAREIDEVTGDCLGISRIHYVIKEGLRNKEIKQDGIDNSRDGPPARKFKLTKTGRKVWAKDHKAVSKILSK